MYTLVNKLGLKAFFAKELPALGLSWIIAEIFYKFGSFTLETLAFLGTWYVTGFIVNRLWSK
jgi:hypothetical protein